LPVPGSIAVTFDDGYIDARTIACETLARYGIPATFFVITGVLDGDEKRGGGPYLTWDDVKSMAAAGFAIGSHTITHSSLGEMELPMAKRELEVSRKRIREEIDSPPQAVSYPYGTVRDFSPAVAEAARKAGYECAVTAIHGLNRTGIDPFLLRRTTLTAGDGMRTFRMILKGHLDPWYWVDKWAYRFQRPRARTGGQGE
jgi:peptidoglycan/xylan/chitin deacetylase (PgdA/CDA1 family)